jgi:PIN domain
MLESEIMTVKELQGMIFIDANSYLTLYWGEDVKKVLPRLEGLRHYIFVTQQIVAEVHRKKVQLAAGFFAKQVKAGKMELEQTQNLLGQVSQSKDEVSKTLAGIFSQAVEDTKDELQHARERRERGNPPGNKSDPLGDQLNWEQVLSHCQNKRWLWVITDDSDYATKYPKKSDDGNKHEGEMFLNAALYQDVARRYEPEPAPEIFCFKKIMEGLDHFAAKTGVKVEKLSSEEIEKINKEQEASLDWLGNYDDAAALVVVQRNEWIRRASLASQMS